jgi:acid-sensing ion channel, other
MENLINISAMTTVNSEGIKILITQPKFYPSERSIERMLPHKQETFVEIRPERTDVSPAVRSLPISDRGCVFNNEHPMKYFPEYHEENCLVECNMALHIKTCDCMPYYFYNTENVETCSFTSIACMVKNRGKNHINLELKI